MADSEFPRLVSQRATTVDSCDGVADNDATGFQQGDSPTLQAAVAVVAVKAHLQGRSTGVTR